jgi:hypothetical protein
MPWGTLEKMGIQMAAIILHVIGNNLADSAF